MRVAAVVCLLLMAGCLGLDPGRETPPGQSTTSTTTTTTTATMAPEPEAPGRIPMLLDFGFRNCTGYDSAWRIPLDEARAHLPEGFEPASLAGPVDAQAEVQFQFLSCEFVALGGSVPATVFGWVAVLLDTGERYIVRMLNDDTLEPLWDAAGFASYTGVYASSSLAAPAGPYELGVQNMSLGAYAFQGLSTQTAAPTEDARVYVALSEDGLLEWEMTQTIAQAVDLSGTLATPGDVFTLDAVDAVQADQLRVLAAEYAVDLWLTP